MAAARGGGIWLGRATPAPQLNVAQTISNFTWSWLVPSTNFVLQQNAALTTANWVTLTNVPSFDPVSLHNQVALPCGNAGQRFFRILAQ